jgi:hypothetical protein
MGRNARKTNNKRWVDILHILLILWTKLYYSLLIKLPLFKELLLCDLKCDVSRMSRLQTLRFLNRALWYTDVIRTVHCGIPM